MPDRLVKPLKVEAPAASPPRQGVTGRLLRILFAAGVFGTTAYFIHDRFFVVSARTAVLVGGSTTLRAPIDGQLHMAAHQPGALMEEGTLLGRVVKERVDTRRLAELQAGVAALEGDVRALEARAQGTRALAGAASRTAEAFRRTRMDQIRARVAESAAQVAAAEAKLREATAAASRGQQLVRQGFATQASMDVLARDLQVAQDQLRAAQEQRNAQLAEQRGAENGIFATDNATDRSISQQTEDRLALSLVEVEALLAERQARLAALRGQEAAEARLVALNQQAELRVNGRATIARLLARPGEYLRAGQDIARLTDCGATTLTAELEERDYRAVRLGQPAWFQPAGSSERLEARVIQLTPISLAPGEARTRPQAILRMVQETDTCETGRMGTVRFTE
ncbi:HlyD family efflux transporter periplasmic adaptor subunit [Rhodovarius crocodyli]|uniref:HlyD family efflux transporter periplasmic adaptor subunit n=1 Tax=Rhodovarius crocodyli TaxID=1979269 RepID=A0A437M2U6_9PROT|nr:HlyD family efflux transporter periplasmic adaptor subunit [Rhodovarius crocodyli]RVT91906.1 HlyD family efflux transporter periplasmic adaptor subunit [Rhodovarius crocodyli]